MKPILEIQNVSKKFRINREQQPYLSMRDSITNFFKSPFSRESRDDFWALRDVSFDVMPGDTIGIIGKNGAGKSTLLKVLSRITPPTSGKIISRGRIASLLEVGTGFHPELSGRENVYMNGSILGMKRTEINKNFDAIVDFAGVEKFIDTPLKHYSSGMQLRLAFAVAAFLENEILIIDEVLAVGDAEFQKKCLGKMDEVSKSGRTVLFVSHNIAILKSLCQKGVVLKQGYTSGLFELDEAINDYQEELESLNHFLSGAVLLPGKNIYKVCLLIGENYTDTIPMDASFTMRFYFHTAQKLTFPLLGIVVKDLLGNNIMGINNKHYVGNLIAKGEVQKGFINVNFPGLNLMYGDYLVDVYFGNENYDFEIQKECFVLRIEKEKQEEIFEAPKAELNKVFYKNIKWQLVPED
jgi:lipopolysaccharide transport system ATP-binding protein